MLHRYLYLWYRGLAVKKFLADAHSMRDIQRQVLLAKLRRNASSEFAREYGLSDARTVDEFRRRMAVTTYEDYRPYIERVQAGHVSALFGPRTRLLMFAMTSGTTSNSKLIPVTAEFFREYRRGWNLWGIQTFRQHLDLARKHVVQLTSDWQHFYTECGIPCGNISGLAAETAPRISDPIFILPRMLMKVTDTSARQYIALRLSMASPKVGMIVTANPSTLVELARMADDRCHDLIRDIHDGAISSELHVSPTVREALEKRCRRPSPKRARALERMVEKTGVLSPRDVWPELSVLALWTGGSVGAYLPRLEEHYGNTIFRDHGLSASEGRMTIPLEPGTSAGVLDFLHHYFEFIPEQEHESQQPTILEAHELEVGCNYYILLTTSSGFYRYDIHDVVQCVGFQGQAPVLKFLNKGKYFSSITGEKLSEFQIVTAVKQAFEQMKLPIEHFTATPEFGDPPGYVLILESGIWKNQTESLARRIDEQLCSMNCEYANRLETQRLKSLRIQEVNPGTWNVYRQQRIQKMGGSLEQYKHPCLINDLGFIGTVRKLEPAA